MSADFAVLFREFFTTRATREFVDSADDADGDGGDATFWDDGVLASGGESVRMGRESDD